jgi:hypothetical protein
MRKIVVALSAAAALLAAGSVAERANAVPLGNPSGIAAAQEDVDTLAKVHCVPGWPHHYRTYWRRSNGCPRYGAYYYGPRFYIGHGFRRFHRPHFSRPHFSRPHFRRGHRGRW